MKGKDIIYDIFFRADRLRAEAALRDAKKRATEAERIVKTEQELRKLGIEPDRVVTEEEVRQARLDIKYVNGHQNIAVVGSQNEGKSTLVNCLRGLDHNGANSAMVGETESTTRSMPYMDEKHPGFVWHDVPGAGTYNFSAWGYYYNQNLFAYDKILLVHSSTLRQLDLKILEICKYRNQKCIVARTKADQHIRNCKRHSRHPTLEAARADYIEQVRRDTAAKNASIDVEEFRPDYTDHIILEMGITQLITGSPPSSWTCEQVIDERALLQELGLL
ncbi:Interferon-inducible GTPase 1-like protein [Cladobotryum mycophilum]|uniref:Interferon-inducible GTPase 1-like protein n=1 Tax=Cladobotryum mycophilum TaxID=491253 RepID=A0ABR0SSZ9_9HYPO